VALSVCQGCAQPACIKIFRLIHAMLSEVRELTGSVFWLFLISAGSFVGVMYLSGRE